MKFKRPLVLVLVLALAMSAVTGGTIAWFTDEVTSANNIIKSGTLDAEVYVSDDGTNFTEVTDGSKPLFNYSLWEPGYTTYKYLKVKNAGDLAFKFQLNIKADSAVTGDYKLADVIEVYKSAEKPADRANLGVNVGTITSLMDDVDGAAYGVLKAGEETGMWLTLKMQETAGNEYQNLSIGNGFSLQLLATQATVETDSFDDQYDANATYAVDVWNGKADVSWYSDEATEYTISTAEQLAGFAELVNEGNTFSDKTIKLTNNIDLGNRNWTPAGSLEHDHDKEAWKIKNTFNGTFDGQGNTISNLTIKNAETSGAALFAATKGATIKNINVKNVDISADSTAAAIVAHSGTPATSISNCNVTGNINIVNNWAYVGGIAGYGYYQIEDCSVIAEGTGVITSKNRNAVGGVSGWLMEDSSSITNCTVKNLALTGWANIGSLTGFVNRANAIDGCTAENINLTKTRADGLASIGLVAGGYPQSNATPISLKDNSLKNITLNGTYANPYSWDILYGSGYTLDTTPSFTLENNSDEGTINNLKQATQVNNVDELKNNLSQGQSVALNADIVADAAISTDGKATNFINITKDQNVIINLNGKNITYTAEPTANGNYSAMQVKGDLTLMGEGTITVKHTGTDMEWNALSAVLSVEGGHVTLGEGVKIVHEGGSAMSYGVDVNTTLGETSLTINGAEISSSYTGVRIFNNNKTKTGTVTLNSGSIVGAKRDIWVHNPSASAVDSNGIVNIAEGYTYTTTVQDTSYNSRIYQIN